MEGQLKLGTQAQLRIRPRRAHMEALQAADLVANLPDPRDRDFLPLGYEKIANSFRSRRSYVGEIILREYAMDQILGKQAALQRIKRLAGVEQDAGISLHASVSAPQDKTKRREQREPDKD